MRKLICLRVFVQTHVNKWLKVMFNKINSWEPGFVYITARALTRQIYLSLFQQLYGQTLDSETTLLFLEASLTQRRLRVSRLDEIFIFITRVPQLMLCPYSLPDVSTDNPVSWLNQPLKLKSVFYSSGLITGCDSPINSASCAARFCD